MFVYVCVCLCECIYREYDSFGQRKTYVGEKSGSFK